MMRRYRKYDDMNCGVLTVVVAGLFALGAASWLALGWLAQTVYLAFAGDTWPRPDYWVFVGAVVLFSILVGGVRRGSSS